jgi:hypothetical protein
MRDLHIEPTTLSPEIHFSPGDNIFAIRGTSAPEDVRALYYPVKDWFEDFVDEMLKEEKILFSKENPLRFQVDLNYFNSSSAKFIYDIFFELKRLAQKDIPFVVKWYYDQEDIDMKEAGEDISLLVEMDFEYVTKPKQE